MGSFVTKEMDKQATKQQLFMLQMNRVVLERQIQMQNQMRERQMAMQIARSRDLFHWWAAFYGTATVAMFAGVTKMKSRAILAPFLPLTFIVGYLGDAAYGSKIQRIKNEAENIMVGEEDILKMPLDLPNFHTVEEARLKSHDNMRLNSNELFL